ncbi:serine hydrolase [Pseudalkalibacillus sp. SCS-8]|uniref:serine hydrolase n=1 Tax=Pseudalkalibacillus nanhaiensis TaxID=3115291 RepID=UPI0032DBB210
MEFLKLKDEIENMADNVTGRLSYYIEYNGETLYKNPQVKMNPASIIKIPIAVAALLQIQNGEIDANKVITVTETEKIGGTGIIHCMKGEVAFSFQNLIPIMISVSDNTATNKIIQEIGIPTINKVIESLGCVNSAVNREIMDVDPNLVELNNHMTAQDVNTLLKDINSGDRLTKEHKNFLLGCLEKQQFNHKLPLFIKDTLYSPYAHKTGDDIGMEHDVGILNINGETLYVSIMSNEVHNNLDAQMFISGVGKLLYDFATASSLSNSNA